MDDPEGSVKAAAESAMREVVGRSNIQPLLTQARQITESDVQKLIQETLDHYKAGVKVTQVQLLKVDPPSEVIASFRDVQAARADQERLQNEAQTYANRVIPEARGQGSQITEAAIAYRDRITNEAQGQADRFTQVYESYRAAPEVTRQRMYLETLEEVFSDIQQGDHRREERRFGGHSVSAARLAAKPDAAHEPDAIPSPGPGAGRSRPMRRGIFGGVGLVIVIVIGILLYLSIFIVDQTQQVLVLRFGDPVRVITTPGLYYKLPLIDNVVYLDKRILDLDSPPLEVIASDQKRLVVDAWGRYKIIDPLKFFQSVGSTGTADSRLSVLLNSAVRQVLGDATFIQLVRDERPQLMALITSASTARPKDLGIQVVDVKIRRADLPEANSQAIYQRMQTERQREATQIRADGEQQARRIRAEADRTATVIVAEATQESERVRGEGEAKRNNILAKAFSVDPRFLRLLPVDAGLSDGPRRLLRHPAGGFARIPSSSSTSTTR